MSVGKLKAASAADLMKSEEPNDSLDTFIRQAIGKEPFLSLSKPGDTPVQWIQLLHALDQQGTSKSFDGSDCCSGILYSMLYYNLIFLPVCLTDLPGWPLLTPLKVQMQKCDKCSREFCSPINYRRHIRVHHRLKKLDKVSCCLGSMITLMLIFFESFSCNFFFLVMLF